MVLARFTSVQLNPPPDTDRVCARPLGPPAAAKANNRSPGSEVRSAGVVTGPLPCTTALASKIKHGSGGHGLVTVSPLAVAVVVLLLESVANAIIECVPLTARVVSQVAENCDPIAITGPGNEVPG